MSGLTESDRLAQAFTACLYLGTEPWSGPKNLKEMTDFAMFHTLKLLLMLLAYREDEEKMEKEIMNSPEFAKLDKETAYVASVLLGNEILMEMCEEEEGDTVDMCGALRTWGERKSAEGRTEGISLLSKLTLKLNERLTDLVKAAMDSEYQQELLREYNLY